MATRNFQPSYKHLYGFILAAVIIIIGTFFRLYPVTINSYRKALSTYKAIYYINTKKYISQQIEHSYPLLPERKKQELIREKFDQIRQQQTGRFDKLIKQKAKESLRKDNQVYLLGADSYYYLRLTEELISEGGYASEFKNGKYFNELMLAPNGHWRKIEVHPYTGFLLYKFIKLFTPDAEIIPALATVPLLLYAAAVLLFILVCFKLKISRFVIFISGVFFSLSPMFIQRSSFGWYDTDPYNIIFPLIAILFLMNSFRYAKSSYFWIFCLSLATSIYSLFWQGWIFLPLIITAYFIAAIFIQLIRKNNCWVTIKKMSVYLISLTVFCLLLLTPRGLIDSIKDILNIFFGFKGVIGYWPDIFITVGELKTPSFQKLSHILGGYIFVGVSIIGALGLLFTRKVKRIKPKYRLAILSFSVAGIIIALSAQRFIIFLLVPAAVCFAAGLDRIKQSLLNALSQFFKNKKIYAKSITYILLSSLLASAFIYGHVNALRQNPVFNEVWQKALAQINEKTPENSIVTTWWPPGHFIKAISKRRVTFDGATLNTPQAYWVARFFTAGEEKEALSILKMLNCSGNQAAEFLINNGTSVTESVDIIEKILPRDSEAIQQILSPYLTNSQIEKFMPLIKCKPPASYCIVYKDLIDSAVGVYFVGNWDFERVRNVRLKSRLLSKEKKGIFKRGTKDNIALMWAISGGATFISEQYYQTSRSDNTVYFTDKIEINVDTMTARINNLEGRISGIPKSIVYVKNGKLVTKYLDNPDTKLSVLLITHPDNNLSCVVGPQDILKSTLFRLYYLDGSGLDHFTKIIQEENPLLNTKIMVYKVNWRISED